MSRKKEERPVKNKAYKKSRKRKLKASWGRLPYTAIVKVMENLSDGERIKTAQVCQSWKDALENPTLWRNKHFEFGGSKANASGQTALAFASSKGLFLRNISIACRHITSNTCEAITDTLLPFAGYLGVAKLEEFRMTGLELDRFWKYAHLRVKVGDCLCQLLQEKRSLKVFEMSLAQFGLLPGTEVLEALSYACATKLTVLLIEDFFHSRLSVFQLERFNSVLKTFSNLREVSLNYCCLSDEVIRFWGDILKGKLNSLQIKACDNEPHAHVISDTAWKHLTSTCPKLTIDLSIVGIGPSISVIPILASQAPITSLHIWSGYDNDNPLQLSDTLNHISVNHGPRLRFLHLDFDNYQDNIDEALVRVVASSKNLTNLRLKANSSILVANAVCQLVRERQTRLTNVDIMLCDMSDPDMDTLRDLREEMEPLAQERGINLVLQNDLF